MIEAMNVWLGVEDLVLQKIKEMVKMLHESSLLIDDIQDDSKMRRGQPAAYLIYGTAEVWLILIIYAITIKLIYKLETNNYTNII